MPDPNHPAWAQVNLAADLLDSVLERIVTSLGSEYAVVAVVCHADGPAQLSAAGPRVAVVPLSVASMLRQAADQVQARHQAGTS